MTRHKGFRSMSRASKLSRRRYLTAVGSAAAVGTAGCLGGRFDDGGSVVLDEQSDQIDSDRLPYPVHGEPFPEIELPDPLAETTVSTADDEIEGQTLIVTAFYAFCPAECLLLMGALGEAHQVLLNEGVDDAVTFLSITFDPERDTAEALEDHADMMSIDLSAGNWRYLRPEDEETAADVVTDELGIAYERDGGDSDTYEFAHQTLTFLVNPDRYVERAYRDDSPDVERVVDDVSAVADAYR